MVYGAEAVTMVLSQLIRVLSPNSNYLKGTLVMMLPLSLDACMRQMITDGGRNGGGDG